MRRSDAVVGYAALLEHYAALLEHHHQGASLPGVTLEDLLEGAEVEAGLANRVHRVSPSIVASDKAQDSRARLTPASKTAMTLS